MTTSAVIRVAAVELYAAERAAWGDEFDATLPARETQGDAKVYPCCDDPECPYCFGSGIYDPGTGATT